MIFTGQRHCWTVRLWRPYERRMESPTSLSRRLCVAAVTTAFVIGVVVGILLPLYVPQSSALSLLPHSALANQELRGNTTEMNPVLPTGHRKMDVDGFENDPEGALSWPVVDTSPPGTKSPNTKVDGVLDALVSSWKFGGGKPKVVNNDASLNRVQQGLDAPTDHQLVFSKKQPNLTDLLFRTSQVSGQQQLRKPGGWDPSRNATSTGRSDLDQNRMTTTPPVTAGLPLPLTGRRSRPGHDGVLQDNQDADPATLERSRVSAGKTDQLGPLDALVDGVYWSDSVEASLPRGFSKREIAEWTSFAGNATVVKVVEGCGRMQNRMLVFDNGTKSCCRYRQNNDQIQGEIFSFYLAQLLGLRSLPPATLSMLHGHEGQWRTVRGQLTLAQWNEQKPVVMTKFVDGLTPAHIPRHFRGDGPLELRQLRPVAEDLVGLTTEELREVAQWSDLVIFDYLTANLDRVVNNMYNKQWNPDMMAAPAHNLAKVSETGLLVFLDNESGLLHGYRLLDKYESYHRAMLDGLCVFRRSTARAVLKLQNAGDVGQRLKTALMESQPHMAEWLPLLPDKSLKILRERLTRVAQQIVMCENMYMNNSSTTDSNLIGSQDSLTKPSVDL